MDSRLVNTESINGVTERFEIDTSRRLTENHQTINMESKMT